MTALNVDDRILLAEYARSHSPDAFAELVRRHARLVYAVALRVTGSPADAEDVAQTCFIELATRADRVSASVAGWLHAAATTRALSAIQKAVVRRKYEHRHVAAPQADRATDLPSWEELEPLIDRAIAALPEELREPLVGHYLEGVSQTALAGRIGVNQSTISRRIEQGVEQLRAALGAMGVSVPTAAAVTGLLAAHGLAPALPAALLTSLAKIGLAGQGLSVASSGARASAAVAKRVVAVLLAGALAGIGIFAIRPAAPSGTKGAAVATTNAQDVEVPGQVWPTALVSLSTRHFMEADGPSYLPAGVPLAHVQALNHAGTEISFSEYAAVCGWAFSFGYKYDDRRTATMAVEGRPDRDGPFEVFAWLTRRLGYRLVGNVPAREHERFWAFTRQHVDAGTPILSDHLDGGIIAGYREVDGRRQVYFGGTVGRGWTLMEDIQGAVYVLERTGEPPVDRKALYRAALERAIVKGSAHQWDGVPQGLAALEAYRKDVADLSRSFEKTSEWFCWATFERLHARFCAAQWLKSAADVLDPSARDSLLAASSHYASAYASYEQYRLACGAGGTSKDLAARIREPQRVSIMLPLLDKGIEEERAAIQHMRQALAALDTATTQAQSRAGR